VNNLDPLMKVGRQVEGFAHPDVPHAERRRRRAELFERYGLSEETAQLYPFELSGGMARRVLLCCALMDDPRVIVADEPTPGLDLDLAVRALDDFRAFADAGGGVMLITHDIELPRVADRVAVFLHGGGGDAVANPRLLTCCSTRSAASCGMRFRSTASRRRAGRRKGASCLRRGVTYAYPARHAAVPRLRLGRHRRARAIARRPAWQTRCAVCWPDTIVRRKRDPRGRRPAAEARHVSCAADPQHPKPPSTRACA
ncbi:MAG: ATP-binding cassette domain-containing protein, partial [Eggerthella lenta]